MSRGRPRMAAPTARFAPLELQPAQAERPEAVNESLPAGIEAVTVEQRRALPGYARHDFAKLAGAALHSLAFEKGMARSDVASMTDDKLREQLRYLTYAEYEE
jgi:hypothetical protein